MNLTAALQATRRRIARAPLRGEVTRIVREALLRGDLEPGSGIHESQLADSLGVSRTPLREALLALEREGFLRSEPGRGFFVAPLTRADAEEIYPLLWTLEGLALHATPPLSATRLDALEKINRKLADSARDPEEALRLDRRWHETLLADCRSRRALQLIESLRDQAGRYEYAFMKHSGSIILSVEQHRELLEALRAERKGTALGILERNWRISLQFLIPWLSRSERPTVKPRGARGRRT